MPIHKSKSRIRFQGQKKKVKQDDGGKAQRKPTRIIYGGASDLTSIEDVVDDEPLFVKKEVPPFDELGDLLRSNLSTSLAAAKASTAQKEPANPPSSPACRHIECLQDEDDDHPVSLLELAPIYRPVGNRLEATTSGAVADGVNNEDNGPSASLLATTAIYRPVNDRLEPISPRVVVVERVEEDNKPPTSPLVTEEVSIPVDDLPEPTQQSPAEISSATETCAIEDDDDPPASLLMETRDTSVDYIKSRAQTPRPFQPQKCRPTTFLQKVVTLFAGRRRCPKTIKEEPCGPSNSLENQQQSPISTASLSPFRPSQPPRRATLHLGTTTRNPIPRKNLPLSPPVLANNRPYRPLDEHPNAPFIEPAKEHKYTGDYSVAPDVFEPAEIQLGFPSGPSPTSPEWSTDPISPTFTHRRQVADGKLLDRNETVWGKWYAKTSNPEDLPFAKTHTEETTEQQAWDTHAAQHAHLRRARRGGGEHASDIDMAQRMEDEEQERAARLRNHPGHCYGAVTGYVYPFQGGHII